MVVRSFVKGEQFRRWEIRWITTLSGILWGRVSSLHNKEAEVYSLRVVFVIHFHVVSLFLLFLTVNSRRRRVVGFIGMSEVLYVVFSGGNALEEKNGEAQSWQRKSLREVSIVS